MYPSQQRPQPLGQSGYPHHMVQNQAQHHSADATKRKARAFGGRRVASSKRRGRLEAATSKRLMNLTPTDSGQGCHQAQNLDIPTSLTPLPQEPQMELYCLFADFATDLSQRLKHTDKGLQTLSWQVGHLELKVKEFSDAAQATATFIRWLDENQWFI
ncbi:hypothetical protein CGMCC3_g12957 [Colletotrichum fructicola]|uniref:Uncharacterized protein n=1 Tax=Colletotrichum fructicola (strain Nara gc5) TaxID=1213859 RepID=A0A7J6IHW4_COLFN|nr:uncharacterized protein CGMCC3_g12957 [Colletotrichum fructicola]KAE9571027.1 hypothetical protein CGMCC3_g12957 [Colletotrichum fructicola]KAF4419008.1 hypothetical protein CFRS1_v015680 [Colletotrichum fructicola]KAF4475575.1 hypothetical protein CGGC5_v015967 [Colletotrichum fructicola Nara gc5]